MSLFDYPRHSTHNSDNAPNDSFCDWLNSSILHCERQLFVCFICARVMVVVSFLNPGSRSSCGITSC